MPIPDDHKVSLRVAGMDYAGWKDVRISAGIERQARDFSLSVAWRWDGQAVDLPIKQGAKTEVRIGQDLVLTGWVFATPISHTPDAITRGITGRSLTADLVDCSAVNQPGQWRKQSVQQVVQALTQPFGLKVISQVPETAALVDHSIEPGETVFDSIDRLLTLSRLLSTDDAQGNVLIVEPGSAGRAVDAIVVGENVLEGSAPLDFSQLMSEYRVVGQKSGTDESFAESTNEVAASVTDPRATRYRPLLIQQQGQLTSQLARERVNWERGSRVGKALTTTYKVQGWRQSNGQLWVHNQLVQVKDPVIGFDREMLITAVEYVLDDNGTVAMLTVAPPEAVLPEPQDPHKARKLKKGGKADNFEYLLPADWDKQ
ncbi:phage baseplate assembly protein [Comamonas jiangduensis]|uniref:phage baseplate assembly protein n=1 Tax=Comamonas jiangduensis TaxID=1194168 RepID=UPI001FE79C07|nr:baseplate protein [Comamonas jiangduensis]